MHRMARQAGEVAFGGTAKIMTLQWMISSSAVSARLRVASSSRSPEPIAVMDLARITIEEMLRNAPSETFHFLQLCEEKSIDKRKFEISIHEVITDRNRALQNRRKTTSESTSTFEIPSTHSGATTRPYRRMVFPYHTMASAQITNTGSSANPLEFFRVLASLGFFMFVTITVLIDELVVSEILSSGPDDESVPWD
ncbi:hypothetical protein F5Y13DRAFT_186916 [Hypoxylon sp. FL1857]|nr:hypothetical protein F5Y13DRAFT_186916 [Hypoxylon sp. FL1857]